MTIDPGTLERFVTKLNELRQRALAEDQESVLLLDPGLRLPVRHVIERALPDQVVVSFAEIPRDVRVEFKSILKAQDIFVGQDAHTIDPHAPEMQGAA